MTLKELSNRIQESRHSIEKFRLIADKLLQAGNLEKASFYFNFMAGFSSKIAEDLIKYKELKNGSK